MLEPSFATRVFGKPVPVERQSKPASSRFPNSCLSFTTIYDLTIPAIVARPSSPQVDQGRFGLAPGEQLRVADGHLLLVVEVAEESVEVAEAGGVEEGELDGVPASRGPGHLGPEPPDELLLLEILSVHH